MSNQTKVIQIKSTNNGSKYIRVGDYVISLGAKKISVSSINRFTGAITPWFTQRITKAIIANKNEIIKDLVIRLDRLSQVQDNVYIDTL